jgi:hypothetical protein
MVNRDVEPFRSPKLLAMLDIVDDLIRGIPEVLTMKWYAHDEESCAKNRLALRELHFALVSTIWHTDFAQVGNKAIQSTWAASDNESAGSIVK